ncbi:hypothetical protein ACFC0R_18210 [Streptomyces sp. NPDC056086]|uniref:hypothetical protein n=1 Tax=Streptomyces sp. NPDC056086 TaxID=3345709 RepID=UPI0035DEF14F
MVPAAVSPGTTERDCYQIASTHSGYPPGVRRPHGPLVIRRPDDEHTFSLLMPVRLEN